MDINELKKKENELKTNINKLQSELDDVRVERENKEIEAFRQKYNGTFLKYHSTGAYSNGDTIYYYVKNVKYVGYDFFDAEGYSYILNDNDNYDLMHKSNLYSFRFYNNEIKVSYLNYVTFITKEEFLNPIDVFKTDLEKEITEFKQNVG